MSTIHHRAWRKLRDRVVREEPHCWLRLPGCTEVSTTADHVIPRSIRPDLTMVRSNLRGACESCNLKRGNRSVSAVRAAIKRATEPPAALSFFDLTNGRDHGAHAKQARPRPSEPTRPPIPGQGMADTPPPYPGFFGEGSAATATESPFLSTSFFHTQNPTRRHRNAT